MRARVFLCLLSLSAVVLGATSASAQPGIPAIVAQAAQFTAVETSGIIVHERHMSVIAAAGPAHFSEMNDDVLLLSDGAYRHIHFLRMAENGRTLSADQMLKRENANNVEFEHGEGFFKQPFDRRYLTDYSYAVTSASGDLITVAFASALRDEQHGKGEMIVDATSGRISSLTYTPYVFPDHASGGTVTETFGEALPGLWTIVRIDSTYSGRVLFVTGHGAATETLDHFHRFTNAGVGFAFYRTAMQ